MAATGDMELYKRLFSEADTNGDKMLSIMELRTLIKRGGSNMTDRQIAEMFVLFDGPLGDKRISFDELCKGLDQMRQFVAKAEQLFKELDKSGDGFLDQAELSELLKRTGRSFTDQEVKAVLREADKNGDNKISFKEFMDACA